MIPPDDAAVRPIRVLVVDDQRLIREGIAAVLEFQPGITVVGTAADGHAALAATAQLGPDVVLMDIRMPGLDGLAATAAIRQAWPACRVLVLTTFDEEELIVAALRAGATGYLLKDLPATDLAAAVRAAHTGVYQLDGGIADKVVAALRGAVPAPPQPEPAPLGDAVSGLSPRELAVLRLIAEGATNREIAGPALPQ